MKRLLALLMVAALMALMLVLAGPAAAQGGCQAFGKETASEAIASHPLGQTLKAFLGTGSRSGLVHEEQGSFCP